MRVELATNESVKVTDSAEVLDRFHSEFAHVETIAAYVLRSVGHEIELDDLVAAGREGLLDAARRFDPSLAVPFAAYANMRIRGAILDSVRKQPRFPRTMYERIATLESAAFVSDQEAQHAFASPWRHRVGARAALAQHLSTVAVVATVSMVAESRGEASIEDTPEEALARAELMHLVRRAITDLSADEAELVRRHYFDGERLDEIARYLDISKSWASRLHARAITRLAKRLRHCG